MMSAHLDLARLASEMTVVVVKLALYSTTSPSVGKTMSFFSKNRLRIGGVRHPLYV